MISFLILSMHIMIAVVQPEENCGNEIASELFQVQRMYFLNKTCLPLTVNLGKGFLPDADLTIKATLIKKFNWFAIELKSSSSGDIPLQVHGRPYEKKIVKNSRKNGTSWGEEETVNAVSFPPDDKIIFSIAFLNEAFCVTMNGYPLGEFRHRLSPSIIDEVRFSGGLSISLVVYSTPIQTNENRTRQLTLTASPTDVEGSHTSGDKVDSDHDPESALPVGMSDFSQMVIGKDVFVDKTDWIAAALRRPPMKIITRPRRFGKTTNLSILYHFLKKDPTVEAKNIFADLNILKNQRYASIVKNHQHKYAAFSFDLLSICPSKDPISFRENLRLRLIRQLKYYAKAYGEYVSSSHQDFVIQLTRSWLLNNNNYTVPLSGVLEQYSSLIEILRRKGLKIAILIDEYDAPLNVVIERELNKYLGDRSFGKGKYEMSELFDENRAALMEFILHFCKSGVKPEPDLVVITGINYVAKSSLFSDMSNFEAYTIMNDKIFNQYFGFKEIEVQELIRRTGSSLKMDDFKKWYDGYHFGDSTIFNPYSVTLALHRMELEAFWGSSGSLSLIKKLMSLSGRIGMMELHFLLSGCTLEKKMFPDLTFEDVFTKKESYWTLLTNSGYLDASRINDTSSYRLKIPNKEVKSIFQDNFEEELAAAKREYDTFLDAVNKLENERTDSLKNFLETLFKDGNGLYHAEVSGSATYLGEELKSLMCCIDGKDILSSTTQRNNILVYQLTLIKADTVYTFNIVKINDMSDERVLKETNQLMELPPSNASIAHVNKEGGASRKKFVNAVIAFVPKAGKEVFTVIVEAEVKSFLQSHFHLLHR